MIMIISTTEKYQELKGECSTIKHNIAYTRVHMCMHMRWRAIQQMNTSTHEHTQSV